VGCGGGDVSIELSRLVGEKGSVLGLDADAKKLMVAKIEAGEMGLANIDYIQTDITEWSSERKFDVVYSRFLFSHLSDSERVLESLVQVCNPGGVVALEDIDLSSYLCYPPCIEFDSFVELYKNVVEQTGADPCIGKRLPELMKNAGLEDIHVTISQEVQGDAKYVTPLSLKGIRDALLRRELITEEKLNSMIEALYQYAESPDTLMSLPRIVQVWGTKKK
jgi:ubiquinone/menaquinone biosynthesis C-methylase UbiE